MAKFPKTRSPAKTVKRVRFNRGSLDSAIMAAKRLKSDRNVYIVPTAGGFSIVHQKPPRWLKHAVVKPDGTAQFVKPPFGGEPGKVTDVIGPILGAQVGLIGASTLRDVASQ